MMTARKASYSSKSFAYDAALLLPVSRPCGGRLHESSPVQADACSAAPFILHGASSSLQSNAAERGKSSSVIPDHYSMRMDKAVMQSCWIQRLNPACQTSDFEEEELTKRSHVWTHFTKDFSSCSKRLQKACHHTRSSSWPPHERATKCSPSPDSKLVEPVDIKEKYLLSRATLLTFREENLRVPFEDGSESNDFCLKTGNLFSNQNSSRKSVSTLEALVPCSRTERICDELHEGKSKDEGKLKNFAAQNFQCLSKASASAVGNLNLFKKPFLNSKFNKENGSLVEVASARVLGDAPCMGKLSASKPAHTKVHIRGSSPDGVIGTSLSPALMGASADADDGICMSPSLIKDVYISTPLKLSINRSAIVFGDTENKFNKDQSRVAFKKYPGRVCGKEMKSGRNFGFLHFAGQSNKTLNQSPANLSVCSGSRNGGYSNEVGVCNRGSGVSTTFKSIQRKQNVAFGNFATNAGPRATKKFYDLQSFNTDSRRCDSVVADSPLNGKEERTTNLPSTRVSSGDFTTPNHRSSMFSLGLCVRSKLSWLLCSVHFILCLLFSIQNLFVCLLAYCFRPNHRESSLDEYWVQVFEDSGPVKHLDTSYSKTTLPQEHITDECHRFNFNATANIWKPDIKEKLKPFPRPSPHIPVNTNNNRLYDSCDVLQQTQVSPRSSFIQTKQTAGLGCASADRSPLEGSSILRTLQEEILQGGMRRLESKTDKKEHNFQEELSLHAIPDASSLFGHRSHKFGDNGRTTEASRLNQAWIQRWRSSSNVIAMSGKTLSPSLGMDKELGSAPAKHPVITSYMGEKEMDCFDGPLNTSYKGEMDMDYVDCNLLEPRRRTRKLHIDSSARHYDSGLGATPRGSFPVYRSHTTLRGKYIAPSVEAMAIVGNTAGKMGTASWQNRGSVSVWPCPSEQERRLSEPKETVEDNMYGVHMDDLEFLEHK